MLIYWRLTKVDPPVSGEEMKDVIFASLSRESDHGQIGGSRSVVRRLGRVGVFEGTGELVAQLAWREMRIA